MVNTMTLATPEPSGLNVKTYENPLIGDVCGDDVPLQPGETPSPVIHTENLNLWFGEAHILQDISIDIRQNRVTALIGPSGCGKSSLLRCFNRMNDLIDHTKITGEVTYDRENIYAPGTDVVLLRKKIGMVFQKPNPFPKSIYENVAYGPRVHGIRERCELDRIVEQSLRDAALWEEVCDRLPVPFDVALQLRPPEPGIGRRELRVTTPLVPVPEAAVDEHHGPPAGHHQVGRPRKVPPV